MAVSHSGEMFFLPSEAGITSACIQHKSFLSVWTSCYIFDVYGVHSRHTVCLRVLAEGLNHLSTFAGSVEEFSTSATKCPEEMQLNN